MQENLRFLLFTFSIIIAIWFIIVTINRNLFLHTNNDPDFHGTTQIIDTDIGDQCGEVSPSDFVDYKMNDKGQLVFLCPQGWSPVQKKIVAVTVPDSFRMRLLKTQVDKLNAYYAPPPKTPAVNPFVQP